MVHHVHVFIQLKEGVLDIQGKAVAHSLVSMGHSSLQSVKVGKYIQLWVDAESAAFAREQTEKMCEDLLVNDIIEQFRIEVEEK